MKIRIGSFEFDQEKGTITVHPGTYVVTEPIVFGVLPETQVVGVTYTEPRPVFEFLSDSPSDVCGCSYAVLYGGNNPAHCPNCGRRRVYTETTYKGGMVP